MTQPSDPDVFGWYLKDNESERQRVRIAIEGRSLSLCALAGGEIARWSLDQLENRSVAVFGRDWVIGDRRLPGPALVIENDRDYAELRAAGATLLPLRERTWRQVLLAAQEAGDVTGWPVLVPIGIGVVTLAMLWLWFF